MIMPVAQKPRVLAFDTSTSRGSVALLQGNALQAELNWNHLQNHSSNLLRSIDCLLESIGWTLQDLNLVAVGTGPGSFTGIRIGIATGLGLAQTLAIPFAGISGMEALAHRVIFLDGSVGVVLNAQREQAYYAEYRIRGGRMRGTRKPSLMSPSDLRKVIGNRHFYLIGENSLWLKSVPRGSKAGWPRAIESDLFLAADIGRRAVSVRRRWKSGDFLQCEPLYIRPPDALTKKQRDG